LATSLTQLLRDIAERLGDAMGYPATGTTTALGSMTTLADLTHLAYSGADADALGNPMVRIDELVGGGPAVGEHATVIDGGLTPATGVVQFHPALTLPVQSGTDYSLWRSVHPQDARKALNRVLRRLDREVLVTVSVFADGDMEETGTSQYSADNATIQKDVGAFHGAQALRVSPTADGGYGATLVGSRVTPGEQLIASAVMRTSLALGGDVILRVANEQTGATLAEARHSEPKFQEVFLQDVTIPGGYETIEMRFVSSLNGANILVDDLVVWPVNRSRFILPSWLDDPADVVEVGYWPLGRALAGSDVYMVDETPWTPWPFTLKPYFAEEGAANNYMIEVATPVVRPLFVRCRRKYDELTTEASTTTADRKLLVDCTMIELYHGLEADAVRNGDENQARLWARLRNQLQDDAAVRAFMGRSHEMRLKVQAPRRRTWRGPA
jgi:hypothetical protein